MLCYCNNDSSLMCKIERWHTDCSRQRKRRLTFAAWQTFSDPCLCLSHFCKPPLHLSKLNVFLSVRQFYCHCQSLVGLCFSKLRKSCNGKIRTIMVKNIIAEPRVSNYIFFCFCMFSGGY